MTVAIEQLTTKAAAEYLNISVCTLWRLRNQGRIKCTQIGERLIRWRRTELDSFLEKRTLKILR